MVTTHRRSAGTASAGGKKNEAGDNSSPAAKEDATSKESKDTDEGSQVFADTPSGSTQPKPTSTTFLTRLDNLLFQPIDISPLVYFRIIFGLIMLWEVYRYFKGGKISRYYIKPIFHFKYFGFHWMPGPLPGNFMYIFFVGMAVLYIFIILGLWYKISTTLAFLGFFYWFFLDMATYLNHFYLVLLINFAMIFIPAHRNASLDVLRHPEWRVATVPAWTKHILTYIVSIPYFFGAIAKLNYDWMHGEPMKMWLLSKMDFPLVGHLFEKWWACYFFSWGGMLFDLIIVPLLLWKRSRIFAIICVLLFHLNNDRMFTIGIFPWFMMFATPLYFEPEWVRFALKFEWIFCKPKATTRTMTVPKARRPYIRWLVLTFCGVLFIMPFRQYLYPGSTSWTEEGYFYSWQMMLRDKDGWADFEVHVTKDDGNTTVVEIDNADYLSKLQRKRIPDRPHLIIKFAHFLCDKFNDTEGTKEVRVYVSSVVGMNGRVRQNMIDPEADLCKEKITLWPAKWIVPLNIPLHIKNENTIERYIQHSDPREYIGRRIAKAYEDDEVYLGTVKSYNPKEKRWRVHYGDGEEEEFNSADLADGIYLYQAGWEDDEGERKQTPEYEMVDGDLDIVKETPLAKTEL